MAANVTVYGYVMLNAKAVATVPWYLVRKGRAGSRPKKIYTHATAAKSFGTPLGRKAIGDAEHQTYSNRREARKAMYQENALPTLDKRRSIFNARWWPRGATICILTMTGTRSRPCRRSRTSSGRAPPRPASKSCG